MRFLKNPLVKIAGWLTLVVSLALMTRALIVQGKAELEYRDSVANNRECQADTMDPTVADYAKARGDFWFHATFPPQLDRAAESYRNAVSLNPCESLHWNDWAIVSWRMTETARAEKAFELACSLDPNNSVIAQDYGNFLLSHNRIAKAAPHHARAIALNARLAPGLYPVYWSLGMAARETAETLLGGNPDLWRVYFMDCLKWVDTEEARELWEDLERILGEIGPECAGRYFSYLASKGEFDEAQALWEQVAREVYGKPWDEETDRFWNGSFDHPIAIEGGLEWRIDKTMPPGVRAIVSSLKGDPRSGSLKIHFDGEENTVFHHVDHWFFVEPGQTYRLHYRVSTMSITTDSGPYVLLSVRSDPALNIRGEMVKGTGEWEFTEEFTVPANGRHAWIEIRRDKSTKPNNRIEGDVWYDDFSLELADTPTADRLSR